MQERQRPNETAARFVRRIAREKAEEVFTRLPLSANNPVLGADPTRKAAADEMPEKSLSQAWNKPSRQLQAVMNSPGDAIDTVIGLGTHTAESAGSR